MTVVVFNQKGGVGKSTITCNLAAISASQGLRTLVIDLDPQGNSTSYLLGAPASDVTPNVAGFFEQTLSSASASVRSPLRHFWFTRLLTTWTSWHRALP
jgi:chromosome partitioning protein